MGSLAERFAAYKHENKSVKVKEGTQKQFDRKSSRKPIKNDEWSQFKSKYGGPRTDRELKERARAREVRLAKHKYNMEKGYGK